MYEHFIKRILDIIIASLLLIFLSPVLFFISILVFLFLGSPIFFKQARPGLNEKIFVLYKFRSMKNLYNTQGDLISDASRLTKFGRFLRATSIDELPELYNILKGDMSFIGPRPLLVEYLNLYNEFQKKRHLVKPGLTGLAQINGRNLVSWEERFKFDVRYIENLNFRNDCIILYKTIGLVLKRVGIHSKNSETIEPFEGNKIMKEES